MPELAPVAVIKNINTAQGHTHTETIRWETTPVVRKPISAITCPLGAARITCPAHGIQNGWRVAISAVQGMKQINAANPNAIKDSEYYPATVIDADTIELNSLDISDYKPYTADGFVVFNTPVDLTGMTYRFKFFTKEGGALIASNLVTDAPNNILLITDDKALKTITATVTSTATTALAGKSGWHCIEAESADTPPVVTRLAFGSLKVSKE